MRTNLCGWVQKHRLDILRFSLRQPGTLLSICQIEIQASETNYCNEHGNDAMLSGYSSDRRHSDSNAKYDAGS